MSVTNCAIVVKAVRAQQDHAFLLVVVDLILKLGIEAAGENTNIDHLCFFPLLKLSKAVKLKGSQI